MLLQAFEVFFSSLILSAIKVKTTSTVVMIQWKEIFFSDLNHKISLQLKMMSDWLCILIHGMSMTWKSKYALILLYLTTFNPDYVKLLDNYLPSEELEEI